jgi:hypothetical protein
MHRRFYVPLYARFLPIEVIRTGSTLCFLWPKCQARTLEASSTCECLSPAESLSFDEMPERREGVLISRKVNGR